MRVRGLSDAPVTEGGRWGESQHFVENSQKVWVWSDGPLTAENCLDFGYCWCHCQAQNPTLKFLKKVGDQEPEDRLGRGDAVASV